MRIITGQRGNQIDKDDIKNKYKEAKTKVRHLAQGIKQDPDTTILKDLVKKVEDVDSKIENLDQHHMQGRPF